MKTPLTCVAVLLLSCGLVRAAEGPFVAKSFNEAREQAGKEQKIVFIDFYTTWCGPCKILDATTFQDEKVVKWLEENTVALKVDAEKDLVLAEQFKIDSYPTLVFVKPDGTELDRILGAVPADDFLGEAIGIRSGKDALTRAKERFENKGGKNPTARLEYAAKLAQMGRHDEALAHLLWCFDEGVQHDAGFAAARASYLPFELMRLAMSFPPAREALQQRREAAIGKLTAATAGTDPAAVDDVTALDRALRTQLDTFQLYERLRAENPQAPAVARLSQAVFDSLMAARRYAEIVEHTDITKRVAEESAQTKAIVAAAPAEEREEAERYARYRLLSTVSNYYQVLIGTKRHDEAAHLAKLALEVDDGAETYNMLAWQGYLTGAPTQANLEQARKANELTGGHDASVIDTLVRVLKALNQSEEACALLRNAVKPLEPGRDRTILEECARELECGA